MNRLLAVAAAVTLHLTAAAAPDAAFRTYEKALDLVHAYSGSGPELQQVMQLAKELATLAPHAGYSQVLHAEALSTWSLNQNGKPPEIRDQVIALSDVALSLNPKLAQAHASKARALLRASRYTQAFASIDAALAIDPHLSSAIFLRADAYRRLGVIAEADRWYRKFIASTSSKSRKSNGYMGMALMYQTAATNDEKNRAALTAKARTAFERGLHQASGGAWRNVNFAIFLNGHAADFDTAERYARKALGMMEFPMARYHLAAARYQKLEKTSSTLPPATLRKAVNKIAESTGIALEQALAFDAFAPVIVERLSRLQRHRLAN